MIASIPLWFEMIVLALVLSSIMLFYRVGHLQRKLTIFMQGKDALSLESILSMLTQKNLNLEETLKAHKQALEIIDARIKKSIRGYALVRYDAYEDNGGNQSFALGLIDENGDGCILSIISNRSHVGVYAKPVNRGIALASLTKEETLALETSKKSVNL